MYFQIDATVVSMYVSKHSFMWQIDFDLIKTKLELLMKYDEYLAPINILRDLDIFLRSDDSILERFKRVTSTGVVKKAMPWMVKCPEPTLKRYQTIHGMSVGKLYNISITFNLQNNRNTRRSGCDLELSGEALRLEYSYD